ncbi:hypothetical protein SRHO_G00269730 [Serrasalmus rhombeus]
MSHQGGAVAEPAMPATGDLERDGKMRQKGKQGTAGKTEEMDIKKRGGAEMMREWGGMRKRRRRKRHSQRLGRKSLGKNRWRESRENRRIKACNGGNSRVGWASNRGKLPGSGPGTSSRGRHLCRGGIRGVGDVITRHGSGKRDTIRLRQCSKRQAARDAAYREKSFALGAALGKRNVPVPKDLLQFGHGPIGYRQRS